MKTAGWSTRRVAGQVDRSVCAVRNCWKQWTREGTHAQKTGSGVYSCAMPDQCGMSHIGKRLCLVMNPDLFWGQMITVYGCEGALVNAPFLNGLPGAIFQQGNALPHTASVAQDFLRHFQTLPWPARSPDFCPVEHVWDQLKRQI
ncbi:uncharacterized protein TNCV_4524611 [Trichonephila clavipes]|nr:uncharacterized protein TNCV_4524611 [Trichonephila clavipes]